jgi:hypothetical protein
MAGRAGWIVMLLGALLVALPAPALADSSQAALAVGVVVPARCAVRIPGAQGSIPAVAGPETVAMRCTRGVLPTDPGATGTAAGPRISSSAESGARTIVTVNF